ncbi:putative Histidine kinase [Candidatus Terasakiella magnetica]|nr:putative Histidine kinase [Candidatus Terasakiella magnetica]
MWVEALRKTMERHPAFDRFGLRRSIRYGAAVVLTGLALWLRLLIAPVDAGIPFVTFFPAIALTAIVGGFWPSMFTTVASAMLVARFFLSPMESAHPVEWSFATFLVSGFLVSTVIEAMHRYYRDYTRVLHDLERSRAEADEARQAAERASGAKSDFLTGMSHELRTPLNAIIGFSDTMLAEPFGPLPTKYAEYAADIHASGLHLHTLINDLLDMSAIEAGKVTLDEEVFDLDQVVTPCIRMIRPRAEQGCVEIIDELPPLPQVCADRRRITQIVLNLLSNAVKFTPPQGRVTVSARTGPSGGIAVVVADTGIGMDDIDIAKALEPFGQIRGEMHIAREGTGLGLPVSRSLARLHGGDLTIESRPRAGTTVYLRIPSERVVVGETRAVMSTPPDSGIIVEAPT